MAHTIHRGPNALFWPPQAPSTPDIHAGKRFIHIKQNKRQKRGGKGGQQKDSNSKRMRETKYSNIQSPSVTLLNASIDEKSNWRNHRSSLERKQNSINTVKEGLVVT